MTTTKDQISILLVALRKLAKGGDAIAGNWPSIAQVALDEYASATDVAAIQPAGMPVEQEPKYGIRDNRLFNRASGEFIPADEPVFIFRARDRHAIYAIAQYKGHGLKEKHAAAVGERIKDFRAFMHTFPQRMKEPDTAAPVSAPVPEAPTEELYPGHVRIVDSRAAPVPEAKAEVCPVCAQGYMAARCDECGVEKDVAARLVKAEPAGGPDYGDRAGFEAWSKREGAMNLMAAPNDTSEDGRYPATYYYAPTETAWRAWANKPAPAVKHEASELHAAASDFLAYIEAHDFGGIPEGTTAYRLREALKQAAPSIAVPAAGSIADDAEFQRLLECYRQGGNEDVAGYIDARSPVAAAPADPMDWPLPCDITVGAGTIRKGCPLSTLVARMKVMNDMIRDGWSSARAPDTSARDEAYGLYTCIGKGGEYAHIGIAKGAGPHKGSLWHVYRCTSTDELFVRTPSDFDARMRLATAASSGEKGAT